VYDCAAGDNAILNPCSDYGFKIVGTDLYRGDNRCNFLTASDFPEFDIMVTNPPFGKKYEFLEKAFMIGKPFAFLLPLTVLTSSKGIKLFTTYGISVGIITPSPHFIKDGKKVDVVYGGCAWFFGHWTFDKNLFFLIKR